MSFGWAMLLLASFDGTEFFVWDVESNWTCRQPASLLRIQGSVPLGARRRLRSASNAGQHLPGEPLVGAVAARRRAPSSRACGGLGCSTLLVAERPASIARRAPLIGRKRRPPVPAARWTSHCAQEAVRQVLASPVGGAPTLGIDSTSIFIRVSLFSIKRLLFGLLLPDKLVGLFFVYPHHFLNYAVIYRSCLCFFRYVSSVLKVGF